MQAFLYLNLTLPGKLVSYQQPVLQLVKSNMPKVAMLDLDADSNELVVNYAKRMLQEATQVVICIKAEEGASIRILMSILEDLLQETRQQLILLSGDNQRIQRILEARPQLSFKQIGSDAEMLAELEVFYD